MKLVALEPMRHWTWVKVHVGCVWCEDTTGIVAVRDNGTIAGAIIFDSWAPNSVQVHQGYEDPVGCLKAGIHIEASHYAYADAGRDLLLGPTPANNEKAIRLNKRFGFREIARIPEGYAKGVDYIIFGMHRDECRWLQQRRRAA